MACKIASIKLFLKPKQLYEVIPVLIPALQMRLLTFSKPPLKSREVMDMLTKLTVVIISQDICVAIITLYTLNLHNVVCQLYLNKTGWGGK